ncbi:hypothetical protein EV189_1664 [Motilibacter rhizosphaerae]|uniref:Uncharacterized protein n=2 Tax=Motilibacter rhizosphaerae TaxID=598652 RepID=A0A4Q7NS24_9ACTN|nr:hypothetical protein EV189_1664 [Motilibacter rhizosphaerae]
MATDEASDRLFALSREYANQGQIAQESGDWGRLSREALLRRADLNVREQLSEGDLRIHGPAMLGHSAELGAVGAIALGWQRAVSAVGAGLEQVKSVRGTLPADVVQRTALLLQAAPAPGSVVLHIAPKAIALDEVEPAGALQLYERPRPLADRASEVLISLLRRIVDVAPSDIEPVTEELTELGPRVGSSLSSLALALDRTNLTLDAAWREPERATVRATVTPSGAKWMREFIAGRGLDAEQLRVRGNLRTISDRERWLVEVGDRALRMDASELTPAAVAEWRVGDLVDLLVRVSQVERPDGAVRRDYAILGLSSPDGAFTPSVEGFEDD